MSVVEKRILDTDRVENEIYDIVLEAYNNCKEQMFYVGLSGGSFPSLFVNVLRRLKGVDWSRWLFFFCDERCVPPSSLDSTYGTFKRLLEPLASEVPIQFCQFIAINHTMKGPDMAIDYWSKMRQYFNPSTMPRFHLLFLGLGPDGHTCSLFPDHRLLQENSKWVVYIGDSPKPPPERVTMTLPVINNARMCVFVATGASKAQVIKEILVDKKPLPAGLINPQSGKLIWVLDREAASLLDNQ